MRQTIYTMLIAVAISITFGVGIVNAASKNTAKGSHKKAPLNLNLNSDDERDMRFNLLSNHIVIKKQPLPRGQFRTGRPIMPPETIMGVFTLKLS